MKNEKKYHINKTYLSEILALTLSFLFAYTAVSKVYAWKATQVAMYNQVIPNWSRDLLLYGIPILELLAVIFLLVPKYRGLGFLLSVILMLSFTIYVAWIWLGWAGKIPCSCGGVLESLGWGEHLVLNIVFLWIASLGMWVHWRK